MNFKLDENVPLELSDDIILAGHEADTVRNEGLVGTGDPMLLDRVKSERRAIITLDKGVADLRRFPPHEFSGIILLRPKTSGRGATRLLFQKYFPTILSLEIAGKLLVISDHGIRIR